MRRIGDFICAMLVVVCGTLVVRAQPAAKTTPAVPRLVKFSGTLADGGGKPLTGVLGVTFSLYEEQEGGSPIWMETQNVQADGNGQYTILLGSTRNDGIPAEAFSAGQRWLGVQAQGEAEPPRVLMTSVPYSLKTVDAEMLGGKPASAYLLAGSSISALPSAAAQPAQSAAAVTARTATAVMPALTSTGTTNYIPEFTDTSGDIGNSVMYQNGSNIGVGTTAAAISMDIRPTATSIYAQLGVAQTVDYMTLFASDKYGPAFYWDPTKALRLGIGGTGLYNANGFVEYMRIQPNGYVGIGTQTPAAQLEVNGNAQVDGNITLSGSIFGSSGANSGSAANVNGSTASPTGIGVLGSATATSGANFGVYGSTASPAGIAVDGNATTGTGVAGVSVGPSGYGVYGANAATSGNSIGVYGVSASPTGSGVYGANTAATGDAYGVNAVTTSTGGVAVRGLASATSGNTFGVYGASESPAGIAVNGVASSGTGVAGQTTSPGAYGVYGANLATTGTASGVYGITASTSGVGTLGTATAVSGSTFGVYGSTESPAGISVYGVASGGTGVLGNSASPTGVGVSANATGGGTALVATATGSGSAGLFTGNVKITGNLSVSGTVSKGGGSFRIDHPLDPEHKYLYHSFVESPDMMNIYNGVATLSPRGDAVVKLPDWFDALNRDFRYQLTCIGGFAPVYIAREVSGNQFTIGGGQPGMKVSWQVTGIRKDAFANEHRIPVEENKPPVE
jgi:hypothetical protein